MSTLYVSNPGVDDPNRGVSFVSTGIYAFNYEAFVPGDSVDLAEIEFYANPYDFYSPPSNFRVSLYSDTGGSFPAPGALIAQLEGPASPAGDAYNAYFAAEGVRLEQGARYWIGFELAAPTGNNLIRARQAVNDGQFILAPGWSAPVHRVVRNGNATITGNRPVVYNLYGYAEVDRRVYGMPANGETLQIDADRAAWIQGFARSTGRSLSGVQILSQHGHDLISFTPVGQTAHATAIASLSGVVSTGAVLSGALSNTLSLAAASAAFSTSVLTGVQASGSGMPLQTALTASLAGVITANPGYTALTDLQVDAGAGHDWIVFPKSTAQLVNVNVLARDGDDDLLFAQVFNPSAGVQVVAAGAIQADFNAVRFAAGSGNDRILLASGRYQLQHTTLNGNAGNDRVILSAVAGRIGAGTLLAAGAGDDRLDLNLAGSASLATVAAGLGSDWLAHSGTTVSALLFDAGADAGNDTIRLQLNGPLQATTVLAGAGDDRLTLWAAAGDSNHIDAGAGNDSVLVAGSGGLNDSILAAGDGHDSIRFADGLSLGAHFSGASLIGGAGADLVSGTLASGAITAQPWFVYSAYSDSTAAAMDSIAIGVSGGQTLQFALQLNTSLALASFSATGYAASNGVVRFSGEAAGSSFAQRFAAVDAAIPQPGRVALFAAADGHQYLFVQGGSSDDLVVQVGAVACSGTVMNDAQLQLAGGNQLALSLASGL